MRRAAHWSHRGHPTHTANADGAVVEDGAKGVVNCGQRERGGVEKEVNGSREGKELCYHD